MADLVAADKKGATGKAAAMYGLAANITAGGETAAAAARAHAFALTSTRNFGGLRTLRRTGRP